jgi:alpha-glucosidase (family GH31 glycosyl hydrolase)
MAGLPYLTFSSSIIQALKAEEAYTFANTQYMFGSEMIVAPIAEPAVGGPVDGTVKKTVWLPPGNYTDWSGKAKIIGGKILTAEFGIPEVPVRCPFSPWILPC